MLHVSGGGGAVVARIQSIQMAAVGDRHSSPRRLGSTKRRPPFGWIMRCTRSEEVVGNWVICGERPVMCSARGAPTSSASALALRVLHQMG